MSLSSRGHWRSVLFHHSHALPSILAWEQDCPTQSWRGHRIARKTHHRAIAEGVAAILAASLTVCFFFTIHTPSRQSWRGHRIATLNPGVGTGLPHSILTLNPGVGTGLPRCFPENAGTTPPDSPPGLRGKNRQCVGTQRCTPGLAARIARKTTEAHCCIAGHSRKKPAAMPYIWHFSRARRPSRLQIWQVTQRKWGRSSCFLRQSIAVSSPLTPWCPWCHARASSSGRQNRAKPWL